MPERFDNIPEHSYKKDEYIVGPFGRKLDNFPRNFFSPLTDFLFFLYDKPATWLHDKVIVPNRKQSVYYHFKFPRVPTVDECYVDDYACLYEADRQYQRDRMVEQNILKILDRRHFDCEIEFGSIESNAVDWCREIKKDLEEAKVNYMIKYGELPTDGTSRLNLMEAKVRSADVYLKQKHRYIWERRQQQMKAKQEQLDQTQESN